MNRCDRRQTIGVWLMCGGVHLCYWYPGNPLIIVRWPLLVLIIRNMVSGEFPGLTDISRHPHRFNLLASGSQLLIKARKRID